MHKAKNLQSYDDRRKGGSFRCMALTANESYEPYWREMSQLFKLTNPNITIAPFFGEISRQNGE